MPAVAVAVIAACGVGDGPREGEQASLRFCGSSSGIFLYFLVTTGLHPNQFLESKNLLESPGMFIISGLLKEANHMDGSKPLKPPVTLR